MNNINAKSIVTELQNMGLELERVVLEFNLDGFSQIREIHLSKGAQMPDDTSQSAQSMQIWGTNDIFFYITGNSFICNNYSLLSFEQRRVLEEQFGLKHVDINSNVCSEITRDCPKGLEKRECFVG